MPKIFRTKDIEQMQASDVTQEFFDYFNRLSDERKTELAEKRPDLYSVLLAGETFPKPNDQEEIAEESFVDDEAFIDESVFEEPENEDEGPALDLSAIMQNAYENIDVSTLLKDDFRPVEALTIDDNRTKCPAHRVPLIEYNPKFQKDGKVLGMKFYHCPECNRLFIKRTLFELDKQRLGEWDVPYNIYDYEVSKKYLETQTEPYHIKTDETIYVPGQWIEENPKCPIHECILEELPCLVEYKDKSIAFDAYYCDRCKKIVLRRTHALALEDQCAKSGIPLLEFEALVKKTPPKEVVPEIEIKPDYYMDEGIRNEYSFKEKADCYKLTESDTVVVSDSIYCSFDGHTTEIVLGLIWVTEKSENRRSSYLFRLGYCSECQKYYMDEADYKTIYKIGRPEVTILMDVEDNTYMISSGEVFDQERDHLDSVEKLIGNEEDGIKNQPDYISQYAAQTNYDDGNLDYMKMISKSKYEDRLNDLFRYKECPYGYRVDITADGKSEIYYIGASEITLNKKKHVISANSKFGRELVHYKTVKIKKVGKEYGIKLSRQFDINSAKLYGYTNLRTDEDIIFRSGITDPFLVRVLNTRKKQHNLIDIFVTIQENQNTIVDAPFEKHLIVQGCAGSGKTMVLLHRLSSLKYNKPDFNFRQDVMILTPNDRFNLHIQGLAEGLQIGSISRISVEQYYVNALGKYSKELSPDGAIASEMSVKQTFVDFIYSDDFRELFDKNYSLVINARNNMVSSLSAVAGLMGKKLRKLDASDDNKMMSQFKKVFEDLSAAIDASERKITEAALSVKEAQEKKDTLSVEIPQKKEYASKVLKEAVMRAKDKASSAVEEKRKNVEEEEKRLSNLRIEQEHLKNEVETPVDEQEPLKAEYRTKNAEWIDSAIRKKLETLSELQAKISENETKKEHLDAKMAVPFEALITSKTSDDADISRLLQEISDKQDDLESLRQNKTRIENGWAIGRQFRLTRINSQISEAEKSIESRKSEINRILDDYKTELKTVSDRIEQINRQMQTLLADINRLVLQNKKKDLEKLEQRIKLQSAAVDNEHIQLKEFEDGLSQLGNDMTDEERIALLTNISKYVSSVYEEIRLYSRFKEAVEQHEAEYAGMDAKIEAAKEAFLEASANRYSEEIRNSISDFKEKVSKYSDMGTYQLIFDATVKPFKEKNKIGRVSGKCHRYDLYARLLFAKRFYGKTYGKVKFMCVDEGQDLAKNEYRLINEFNDNRVIFNIFGDTNQLMKMNRGISDWAVLDSLFKADQYVLNENYRNTNQITRFCNDSFNMSVLQTGVDGAKVREINKKELEQELSELHITTERVAVLLPRGVQKRKYISMATPGKGSSTLSDEITKEKVALMYVDEVKGIEFDKVYVVSNKMGKNEKYIAYTRALSELIVVNDENVPAYDDSGKND